MSRNTQWELSSDSPAKLCARCLEIFGHASSKGLDENEMPEPRRVQNLVLHRELSELINGALQHCWCCVSVCADLRRNMRMVKLSYAEFLEVLPGKLPKMSTKLLIHPNRASKQIDHAISCDFAVAMPFISNVFVESLHLANRYSMPKLTDNSESEALFEYISSRLKYCQARHALCQSDILWYPKRLIAIEKEDDDVRLRVIQTAEETLTGPYITLSHCWGKAQPLRLTSDNLEQFGRNIPMEKIPPLHKDAVTVAMRLGVNYLWIDCLCIIQDSIEDWRRESATMGDVYKHGLLNIAAASAMDSSGRLFEPQKPSSLQPDVVSMFMNGTQNQVLWYAHGKDSTVTNTIWDTWRSPLFQRAWVLQETLLASRAVVFTLDKVHFRCAEEISSGSMPADHPILQFDKLDKAFNREQRFIASMKFLSRENMVEAWREIVQRYSRTSITRISDRLVAMSAIARHFSSLKQSPYHAGLWEDTFINDMAWFTCDPRRRDDIYVAPSWSWASLSEREDRQPSICPFPMNTGNQVQIAKVLEVRTKPSGQDEFGAVDSGWLRICAPLYYMGQKNEWELLTTFKQRHGVLDADTFNARVFRDYLWEDDPVQPNIFALPLIAESFDSALEVRLILLIAVTPAKNVYKRVGFCLIRGSSSEPNSYRQKCVELQVAQDLKEFLRRMERRDEDIHSHEMSDNGWHTITII